MLYNLCTPVEKSKKRLIEIHESPHRKTIKEDVFSETPKRARISVFISRAWRV